MTRFVIDPDATTVWIDARSSLHPIHSETTGMTGFFEASLDADGQLDLGGGASAGLEMEVASMSSGNPLYDREMKRRIDARRYPTITAKLTALSAGRSAGSYTTEGDVTFKGVTQRVTGTLDVSMPESGTIVFEGSHVFQLPDFGMDPPKIMMLRVYPDVTVRVRIVAKAEG